VPDGLGRQRRFRRIWQLARRFDYPLSEEFVVRASSAPIASTPPSTVVLSVPQCVANRLLYLGITDTAQSGRLARDQFKDPVSFLQLDRGLTWPGFNQRPSF